MKKSKLTKLALLGMAGGVLAAAQPSLEGVQDNNSIDIQHLIAMPKCAAHGCASLTADSDAPTKASDDKANGVDLDDDTDQPKTDDKTKNSTPKKSDAPAASKYMLQC